MPTYDEYKNQVKEVPIRGSDVVHEMVPITEMEDWDGDTYVCRKCKTQCDQRHFNTLNGYECVKPL